MPRFRKLLWSAVLILFTHMPVYAQSFMEHSQALDQLDALFLTDEKADITAFRANPKLQEVLEIVTDSKKYLDGFPLPKLEQGLMCLRISNTMKKFFFFGIPNAENLAQEDPKNLDTTTRTALERNMTQFLPEIERLEIFGIRCSEKLTQQAVRTHDPENTSPDYKTGLEKAKIGAFKLIFSTIAKSCMTSPPVDYRIHLSKTLAETAPTFASIFSKHQRGVLIAATQKIVANVKDPSITANIAQVLQAFETAPCTSLCGL